MSEVGECVACGSREPHQRLGRAAYCARCIAAAAGITQREAATLAGLRDDTLVAVPIAGSTRMLSDVARKHYRSEAELFSIWCDCVAVFHPASVEKMRAMLATAQEAGR